MNRRSFLKTIAGGALAFAVPELIVPERKVWALDSTMIRPKFSDSSVYPELREFSRTATFGDYSFDSDGPLYTTFPDYARIAYERGYVNRTDELEQLIQAERNRVRVRMNDALMWGDPDKTHKDFLDAAYRDEDEWFTDHRPRLKIEEQFEITRIIK